MGRWSLGRCKKGLFTHDKVENLARSAAAQKSNDGKAVWTQPDSVKIDLPTAASINTAAH
jgi:hypothetical protein